MATAVIMPKFGMAQTEGTVIRWLKAEGDRVQKGEALLEVQTDKVDMEVEAPATGILSGLAVGPNATVPVTTLLAHIVSPGETFPAPALRQAPGAAGEPVELPAPRSPRLTPVAQRMAAEKGLDITQLREGTAAGRITKALVANLAAQPQTPPAATGEPIRATPAARRLARAADLALANVTGSGPQGRIQARDVEDALAGMNATLAVSPPAAQVATVAPTAKLPLQGMRKTIATRLTQSWQTIPHIMLTSTLDLTQAEQLRQRLGPEVAERHQVRLTLTVLLAKAVAAALIQHPRLNQWLVTEDGSLLRIEQPQINLGLAVALPDGLIVPVIKQAETLGLVTLARQVADLAQRARTGQLQPDEVSDGTFTLSNLGMFPVDHFTALINPPQVAILAVGQRQIAPRWDGHTFQPTPQVQLTLSADHRAVDGAVAAAFLAHLKELVEDPTRLLL